MDINTYNAKLAQLNMKLNELTPQKILNDKAIEDAEALFMQQFGTVDVVVLESKLGEYNASLAIKEQELTELNATFAAM